VMVCRARSVMPLPTLPPRHGIALASGPAAGLHGERMLAVDTPRSQHAR